MRLIIAGSRSITEKSTVKEAFENSQFRWDNIDILVNGDADGVDSIAKELVENKEVDIELYPADDFLEQAPSPKVAPVMRNTAMAENADALLAIWDGESTGTEDMINKAEKENLTIEIHRTDTQSLADF